MAATTDNADATRAAMDVMAAGGNAVDGAIAAALALGVVNPSASGIGGGGFALVFTAKDKKVHVVDFRETAPEKIPSDLWPAPRGAYVGVPGEPAGLEHLSRKFGRKTLADDAKPAITYAQHGFFVGKHTAMQIATRKDKIIGAPSLAKAFFNGGTPVPYATRVKRPDLAATLARFGAEGRKPFYEGDLAQKIVDAVKAAGGGMTAQDLSAYQVKEREPLSRTIDGRTVYTMPAPSAGGLMLLETLGMFGASPSSSLASSGFGSSAYLHTIAEAMRGAVADRARFAADPDIEPTTQQKYEAALDPKRLADRKARIDPNKTHPPMDFITREKGTTHLAVADAEGNVVSLTTTVNSAFGTAIVPEGTGILLNDELADFTSPEEAKRYGVTQSLNRPRPRARPVSSMTPTIVVENGLPILAVGGSGGPRIATGVTQATLARLVFDLDPNACVSHPRVHVQGADLVVDKEIPEDVRVGLEKRGEKVKESIFNETGVLMLAWKRGGPEGVRILAAADPRKAGFAAAR